MVRLARIINDEIVKSSAKFAIMGIITAIVAMGLKAFAGMNQSDYEALLALAVVLLFGSLSELRMESVESKLDELLRRISDEKPTKKIEKSSPEIDQSKKSDKITR